MQPAGRSRVRALLDVPRSGALAALVLVVSLSSACLLGGTESLALTWWVPTVDGITVILYSLVAALAAVDALARRDGRALPVAGAAAGCGLAWLVHLTTSPGLVPGLEGLATVQASQVAFDAAHIGVPLALSVALVTRAGILRRPRLAVAATLAGAVLLAAAVLLPLVALAGRIPATVVDGQPTQFSRVVIWLALLPVAAAVGLFFLGHQADRRTLGGTAAALVFIVGEALVALLGTERDTVPWYVQAAMRALPAIALMAGQLQLYGRSVAAEVSRIEHLSLLNDAGAELARLRGLGEVRAGVVRQVVRIRPPAGRPCRAVLVEARGDAVMVVAEADGDRLTTRHRPVELPQAVLQVIEEGVHRVRAVADLDVAAREHLEAQGVTHVVSVPVRRGEADALLLSLAVRDGVAPSDAEVDTLRGLANVANLALVNAEHFARLRDIAATDTLTGLPNRREFERIIGRPRSRPYAILAIDVDNLKQLNDTDGHEAGDQALRLIGAAFAAALRAGDVVARTGGDEFAGYVAGASLDDAFEVAERLRGAVRALALRGGIARVSIGVAAGRAGDEPHDVWTVADGALMTAKRGGRDRTEVARPDAGQPYRSRLARWESLLPEIIESRGIGAVFQPIVDLSTGAVTAYEALARPTGPQPPDGVEGLFGAAQRLGMIRDLDWLCRRAAIEGGAVLPPRRPLFLNVGVGALLDPLHDVDQMLLLLRWVRREPAEVVLEITEREAVRDMQRLEEVIARYREHGFRFALDDVGEGHSTFEVLAAAIPEFVKVSQTLVNRAAEPGPRAAITALVAFAMASGAQVIAEGLERDEDRERMSALGATLGQGWLLGRPAAAGAWAAVERRRVREVAAAAWTRTGLGAV